MERLFIVLIISALSCYRAAAQTINLHEELTELDRAIKLSPEYVAKKQENIDHLKEKLAAATEARTRFRLTHELYEEYLAFSNDSALSYISRCVELARQAGSTALVGECLSEMAFQYSNTGMYDEAHYAEALAAKRRYADADIEAAAKENLRLLDGLGKGGE